ncbi:MAG: MBL fold metallo-hydrolase [Actinomycetota bacterium]|nr:MBL fold metallo-hydrolase [Actinomycetota bacterium]
MDQSKGGHVHAFLLDEGTALTLIDTLFDTDARRIIDRIGSIGRSVEDLKHIVLTHAHRSHLGGLATLKELSGATVYSHAWEADIVAGERTAQPVTPVPMRPLSTYWSVYYLQLGAALGRGKHPPCPVDTTLEDGDTVGPVRVLHTPGHTPGHLAFWWPESRALFAGDAIATYPVFGPGWPAFTLNPTQHRASLRRMAELDPAVLAVGHGDPLTAGAAERVRSLVEYR